MSDNDTIAITSTNSVTTYGEWDVQMPVVPHVERIYQAWLSGRQRLEFFPDGRAALLPPYATWVCPNCKVAQRLDVETCPWCVMEGRA